MKIFFTILFLCLFISFSHAEEVKNHTELKAVTAINIFTQSCFFRRDKKQRSEFLNEKFTKHNKEKSEIFLSFTDSKKGEVWAAVFVDSAYAIVVEDDSNCHVIARYADGPTIHKKIEELYKTSEKNLPDYKVVYNGVNVDTPNSSGFEILKSDNSKFAVVAASTINDPPENKHAAIITMTIAQK